LLIFSRKIPVDFLNSSTFQYTIKIKVHFQYVTKFQYAGEPDYILHVFQGIRYINIY